MCVCETTAPQCSSHPSVAIQSFATIIHPTPLNYKQQNDIDLLIILKNNQHFHIHIFAAVFKLERSLNYMVKNQLCSWVFTPSNKSFFPFLFFSNSFTQSGLKRLYVKIVEQRQIQKERFPLYRSLEIAPFYLEII